MNIFSKFLLLLPLLLLGALLAPVAQAEQLPRWELGAGAAVINFPNYRGSDRRQTYLLPAPYIIYRGAVFQIDRQRARGLLFKSDWAELDVSINGSVPVRSKDNPARQGMPNIEPTVEVGPVLKLRLLRSDDQNADLSLRLPLRPVIATNFRHLHSAGLLFHPQLNANFREMFDGGWNLGFVAGPLIADRRYHQFFYDVPQQYATASRPAYRAHGGYSGVQFTTSLSKRFPSYWLGSYLKYDDLHGAAFTASPLVKSKHAVTAGFAVTWIFASSDEQVEYDESSGM